MIRHLAKKLNKLAREDVRMRRNYQKGVPLDKNADKRRTAALKVIINRHGWPTIPLVGEKASRNAWLIAQHADHDRRFQTRALKLLTTAYQEDQRNIDPTNIAYLTDRLLVASGRKQEFGTQFKFDKRGALKLCPLRNPKTIDATRNRYHLPPLRRSLKEAEAYNKYRGRSCRRLPA